MLLLLTIFSAICKNQPLNNCAGVIYKKIPLLQGIKKKTATIFLCCLFCMQLHAQLKPFYLFKFDKINTGVKPLNQTVLCMAQDSVGFMWFGTSNGLYRYDGNSFTPFEFKELAGIEIRSLLVDSKKNMWIATTWQELYMYNMYKHKLTHYIYDTASLGSNASQAFTICEGKNNTIWLATALGLLTLDAGTGKFGHHTKTEARSVCLYKDTVWAGLLTGGIKCFNPVTGAMLATPPQWGFLANPDYIVTYLYPGKNKYFWIGTNLGLFLQNGEGVIKKFYNATKNDHNIPDNNIHYVVDEKDAGYTWVSTPKGIGLYDDGKGSFVPIQNNVDINAVSVIEKPVICLCRDVSGKIWTGTDGSGIFSFYPRKIKVYRHTNSNVASIHSNSVKRVFIFDNNLLVAVYAEGIDIINLVTNICNFYPFNNTLNPSFSTIQYPAERDKQTIFVGSAIGLFIFDVHTHTYTPALPAKYNGSLKYVQAARYDKDDNLWIGCEQDKGGLYEYNGHTGNLREFKTGDKGLLTANINLLTTDEDDNIVVCNYASVQKYMAAADSFIYLKKDNQVMFSSAGICFQNGVGKTSLTGSYQNGIFLVNKNLEVLDNINESNGLSSNTVLSFLQNGPQSVWACTFWGVNKITFNNNGKSKYTITHIDNSDGLPGEEIINMVARETGGEKTYFLSSNDGLVEVKEPSFTPNNFIPPVVITSLSIADTVILPLDSSHILSLPVYLTKAVHLSYTKNSFQVTFAALNYINAQKNQYAYMLQGIDKDWRYTSNIYSASYSNLRPGTYTFLVKASNDAGIWNEQPAKLLFIIKPPFWETIWAYMLYAVTAAGIVYGIYISRIKQYRAKQETQLRTMIATQEQERKRISRDLHDDVGTKLSALKLFVSTFKNNLQKKNYTETEALAQSTEELIDETISDVRVMLMNLSPGILEEFGYVTAVEGLVNKINEAKIIKVALVTFGIKQRFEKDYELALYRITQELVNNVLKHAEAKNASLQIGYRDEKIILMIEDDGKGFDVTTHKEGYGLNNLDARTKLLQGTMSIDSLPGNGTSVLIEVPYQFN